MSEKQPSIRFRLEPRSGVAPYRQLVDQVAEAIATGRLVDGDQLPSVRDVVGQITINPNTVHRAYREMEHQGLVEGRLGLGTFVTAVDPNRGKVASDELAAALHAWAKRAAAHGITKSEALSMLESVYV